MTRYYINGKRTTKKEYQEQDKINKKILNMDLGNTTESRNKWLEEMQKAAFLTKF